MPSLSNSHLAIEVKLKGAELSSVKHQQHNFEYIWQADPTIWGRHAPVLFPIVGRLKDDSYQVNGRTYHMKQHGLARNLDFTLTSQSSNRLDFSLESNDETKMAYPFDWKLQISYVLNANKLQVIYLVDNTGDELMPFSIGAHPGFNVPIRTNGLYSGYEIRFDQSEVLDRWLLEGGLFSGESRPQLRGSDSLSLEDGLFDEDALVFHHPKSSQITLQTHEHQHSVRMGISGWPYLGIWAKPNAPFVCLEPWKGLADYTDSDGDIFNKKGIITLAAGTSHSSDYEIEFK